MDERKAFEDILPIEGAVNSEFVIPKREHSMQNHDWQYDPKDGTMLICHSCSMHHGMKIQHGKVATKVDGVWRIEDMYAQR